MMFQVVQIRISAMFQVETGFMNMYHSRQKMNLPKDMMTVHLNLMTRINRAEAIVILMRIADEKLLKNIQEMKIFQM